MADVDLQLHELLKQGTSQEVSPKIIAVYHPAQHRKDEAGGRGTKPPISAGGISIQICSQADPRQ